MNIKNILLLIVLQALSACTPTPKYIVAINHLTSDFSKEVYQETGLKLAGSGGALMDDIKKVSLTFIGNYELEVPEVRILMVGLIEKLLLKINTDQSVRPYLHNFPFTRDNLMFHISFGFPDFVRPPYIAFTLIVKDKIYYDVKVDDNLPLETFYEESYEEAFRIYQNSVKPF